jgi:hypothetical protein
LVEAGLVRDLLDDGQIESSPEDFLKAARAFLAEDRANNHRVRQKERRRAGRQLTAKEAVEEQIDIAAYLKPEEILRAQVIAEEMVRAAEKLRSLGPPSSGTNDEPVVAAFRKRVLGGTLASPAQAERLFKSIGAALFENEFFLQHNIPVLDHNSELTTAFDWDAPDMQRGLTPRSEITFWWNGHSLAAPLGDRVQTLESPEHPIFPLWRANEYCFAMNRNSISGRLMHLAMRFTEMCPWRQEDAALFVLTGISPPVLPMDVGIPNYSQGKDHALMRVELSIHPWVSAEAVLKLYKSVQRIAVGSRNRAPAAPSLRFFNFVSRRRHEGKTFREAMRAWVKAHPHDMTRFSEEDPKALARFSNQYRDIERQVLRPFGRPSERRVWF